MKKFILTLLLPTLVTVAFAQKTEEAGQKSPALVFFSDEVPRYTGIAVGASFLNQWPLGVWGDFAKMNMGGGLSAEYTLPQFLPLNLDLGGVVHAEFSHTFPKSDGYLKTHNDIRLAVGAFLRVPLSLLGQNFAFQPEFAWGLDIAHTVGQNGSAVDSWGTGQIIMFQPALRYMLPVKSLDTVEVEASPLWTISPEKESNAINNFGYRIGVVWHVSDFAKTIGPRMEARKQAKEEKLRKGLRDELKKELENPALFLGVNEDELKDFTPDGDGVNDTITFHPSTKYTSAPTESWKLVIADPKGNIFKTWSGNGYPPAEIVWDGKGDDNTVVFSRETYIAILSVAVCEKDRERLGRDTLEATIDGNVSVDTGIVLNKTGDNEWRIEMASFTFDENAATFDKMTPEKRAELNSTLDDITTKALAIKGAKITVEGYANNVSGTEEEEQEELLPLSQTRAEAIASLLVERGIKAEDINARGMGSANPKASREDQANWWKNRRIEFYIKK